MEALIFAIYIAVMFVIALCVWLLPVLLIEKRGLLYRSLFSSIWKAGIAVAIFCMVVGVGFAQFSTNYFVREMVSLNVPVFIMMFILSLFVGIPPYINRRNASTVSGGFVVTAIAVLFGLFTAGCTLAGGHKGTAMGLLAVLIGCSVFIFASWIWLFIKALNGRANGQ